MWITRPAAWTVLVREHHGSQGLQGELREEGFYIFVLGSALNSFFFCDRVQGWRRTRTDAVREGVKQTARVSAVMETPSDVARGSRTAGGWCPLSPAETPPSSRARRFPSVSLDQSLNTASQPASRRPSRRPPLSTQPAARWREIK